MAIRVSLSPVLYRVINGSSSTTLRPVRSAVRVGAPFRLFHNSSLNNAFIYKFPHFDDRETRASAPIGPGAELPRGSRQIETGLFFPDREDRPEAGGTAIYVGQRNFRDLLLERIGMDVEDDGPEIRSDLRVLDAINDLPSLDPFLMKVAFESLGITIAEGAVPVTDAELRSIREILAHRIGPVISKAFLSTVVASSPLAARIATGVTNPSGDEMLRFCAAFRIDATEAPGVIFALQGMAFYEHLLQATTEAAGPLAKYLREEAAKPSDASRRHGAELARLTMLREECLRFLRSHISNATHVFKTYDEAVHAFVVDDSPGLLVEFLRASRRAFWQLGHCVTARINAAAVLDDSLKTMRPVLGFGNVETTVQRIRAALAPRIEMI